MVRTLAAFNPPRMQEVYRWPMREALLAYLHYRQVSAARDYRNELLQWASLRAMSTKKLKAPPMPAILKVCLDG